MTQIATVQEVLSTGRVRIAVKRISACGEHCAACGGCGDTRPTVMAEAIDPLGVRVGDRVVVESSTTQIYRAATVVYAVPIILFFVGYFIGYGLQLSEGISALIGFVFFLASFFVAKFYNKRVTQRNSISFVITKFAEQT